MTETPNADPLSGGALAPDAVGPRVRDGKIRCDACPVMCYIADGKTGACDRYANDKGTLVRCDPVTVLTRAVEAGGAVVPFAPGEAGWDGRMMAEPGVFVTAVGAGTTYPDYKPAPFIVSQQVDGADMVTVVSEGIFSYCGVKVKIDTDRHLGHEGAAVRVKGEPVGHVTTAEYGSQMLSLGGVRHLTGGSKAEGRITCEAMLALCNREAVEMTIDDGSAVVVQAGAAPVVDGREEARMRVGCGSATIGMFATQWQGLVDEVVVVDDHITGVVSEHQAGKVLDWPDTGIRIRGRRSTPGRYFRVAEPGLGWGGTDIEDPLSILDPWLAKKGARAGLTLLMISTTGEQYAFFELDEALTPQRRDLPVALEKSVALIAENCEPALCSVLFMGGAGGSLRAGVTENPVRLTRAVHAGDVRVSVGGAPVYLWPGGGITIMADVTRTPLNAFGYVPTPALVAPIEFTMPRGLYEAMGGHAASVRALEEVLHQGGPYGSDFVSAAADPASPWPLDGS